MPTDLFTAFQDFDDSVSPHVKQYSGLLGLPVTSKTVEVPNRNGYVYVRLRDNTSEIVQAYNEKVSPVYNLPVIIERQGNRWVIVNRDIERYENWGSYSAFLPAHAHQHEFDRDNPGGDTVFSYVDQLMPLNVYPSGTPGSPNVIMGGYSFKKTNGDWAYVGNTGTNSLLVYKPTDNQARMVLVYLDRATGNPGILVNSGTSFAASLTGTHDVLQYLPTNASTLEPAKAVRLVSGTTYIGWENLYDVRQFFGGASSTGTSGGGIEEAPVDGLLYGRKNAGWTEVSGTAGGDGTPGGSDTHVQYNVSGSFGGISRFTFDYTSGVLVVGNGTTVPAFGTNEFHLIAEASSPGLNMWAAATNSAINPYIKAVRYRGTFASPQALDQFDEIFQIRAAGYNGTNLTNTQAEIMFDVPYTWSSGSHPTEIGFWVTASGTATLENVFKARSDGINLASGKEYLINGSPHSHEISFRANKGGTNQTGISGVAGTDTKLTFGTEIFDVGGYYDTSTSRFTPPAGRYFVGICCYFNAMTDQVSYGTAVYINGVKIAYSSLNKSSGTGGHGTNGGLLVTLDGDDYVEAYCFQESGVDQVVNGAAILTYFYAFKV